MRKQQYCGLKTALKDYVKTSSLLFKIVRGVKGKVLLCIIYVPMFLNYIKSRHNYFLVSINVHLF